MKISIYLFLIVFIIGCGKHESNHPENDEAVITSNVWARPGVKNRNTAAFMKITNGKSTADTLYSVFSDIAEVVEIHETYSKGNDMKGMRRVDNIAVHGNSYIELKPGGFHIMLIGLKENLESGMKVKIDLSFKKAGKIELTAEVK